MLALRSLSKKQNVVQLSPPPLLTFMDPKSPALSIHRRFGGPEDTPQPTGITVESTADGFVRKNGRRVSETEAANMRFVADNTTIPIPKLISCTPLGTKEGMKATVF
jgi:hypothetical protein